MPMATSFSRMCANSVTDKGCSNQIIIEANAICEWSRIQSSIEEESSNSATLEGKANILGFNAGGGGSFGDKATKSETYVPHDYRIVELLNVLHIAENPNASNVSELIKVSGSAKSVDVAKCAPLKIQL
jgi:hypothetical protein